mgnify:CR=1 FL=1
MSEYNAIDLVAAMSKYRAYSWNDRSETPCAMFLMNADDLEMVRKYFEGLYGAIVIHSRSAVVNTFQGVPIVASNDIELGSILVIKEYNRVFP